MMAAKRASAHWPQENVHSEYFTAPDEPVVPPASNHAFQVKTARTNEIIDVAADQSIVAALREHGLHIDTACESGYCGTCITRYLAGEPEHRDAVLDDTDREHYVLICCARSKSPLLVLDL